MAKAGKGTEVALLLSCATCVIPFLVPYHQPPLPSFYSEWIAGVLGAGAVGACLIDRSTPLVKLPWVSLWLLCFAVLLALRAVDSAYVQLPLIAAAYVVFAAGLVWVGRQLCRAGDPGRVAAVLAAGILTGAVLNATAGIAQIYGRPAWLEDVVAAARGPRAFGNIAQANLYANYLAIGQAALLYMWSTRRLSTMPTLLLGALLVWGSALSGSRMGMLYPVLFALLAMSVGRGANDHRKVNLRGVLILCAAVVAAHALAPLTMASAFASSSDRALDESVRLRFTSWQHAVVLFAQAPVLGVGPGAFAGAAFEAGLTGSLADSGSVWTSPHNIVLHLMSETGLAGLLLVGMAFFAWARNTFAERAPASPPTQCFFLSAASVGLLHSMVEFPLWSAHFLAITALFMGLALQRTGAPAASPTTRATALAVCALMVVVLGWVARDYWLLDITRVTGTDRPVFGRVEADSKVLESLSHGPLGPEAEKWAFAGLAATPDDLQRKLELGDRVVRYWPSREFVAKRAALLAIPEGAAAR